jgi:hypothetical protein
MDFISGALPNVMFIAGLIAVGIALGIEFKIVEIKGQLSKHGRIAAFLIGIALIGFSIHLYTKPSQVAAVPSLPTATTVPVVQANMAGLAPTPLSPTVVSQPSPAAVVAVPAGKPFEIEGVIRQVDIQNNQTMVVIDRATYLLPSEMVVSLGPSLQVGTTLKLTGTQLNDGTITVTSVVVSNTSANEDGDKKDEDKKDKEHED